MEEKQITSLASSVTTKSMTMYLYPQPARTKTRQTVDLGLGVGKPRPPTDATLQPENRVAIVVYIEIEQHLSGCILNCFLLFLLVLFSTVTFEN